MTNANRQIGRGPAAHTELTYGKSVILAVLTAASPESDAEQNFRIEADGVWLRKVQTAGRGWHPMDDLMKRGSPDPDETPWLAIPFTARQLAAFMVDGCGRHYIQMDFADWEDGSEEWTAACTTRLSQKALEAMLDAYSAYSDAAKAANHLWPESVHSLAAEHALAKAALKKFELEHGQDFDSTESGELRARERELSIHLGNARHDRNVWPQWRRAVVRDLLRPQVAESDSNGANADSPRPLQRWRAQEQAVLAKLRDLGYDPLALPPLRRGQSPSPVKAAVQVACQFTDAVMKKVWGRLLRDKMIRYS